MSVLCRWAVVAEAWKIWRICRLFQLSGVQIHPADDGQVRFGPYLQLGEVPEGSKEKPKRASIPRAFDPNDIDLETALKFLALPREIGLHPETQTPIVANFGRFGPFTPPATQKPFPFVWIM